MSLISKRVRMQLLLSGYGREHLGYEVPEDVVKPCFDFYTALIGVCLQFIVSWSITHSVILVLHSTQSKLTRYH